MLLNFLYSKSVELTFENVSLIQLALSSDRNPQNVSSFLNLLNKIAIELTCENFHQTRTWEWSYLSRSWSEKFAKSQLVLEFAVQNYYRIDFWEFLSDVHSRVALSLSIMIRCVAFWLCCYVAVLLCCCVAVLLCSCVAVLLCCCVAVLLCCYVAVLLCCYVAVLLCSCVAVYLCSIQHMYEGMGIYCCFVAVYLCSCAAA